jgi:hypothetical protein
MKKIFTLLLATGTITLFSAQASAQRNSSETRAYHTAQHSSIDKSSSYGYEGATISFREKEAQIRNINRAFDRRIVDVRRSRYLLGHEKAKQIRMLETQRSLEIRQVHKLNEKTNRTIDRCCFFQRSICPAWK